MEGWPPETPIQAGEAVAVVARLLGLMRWLNACRLVCLVDEADKFGFAYGTLPGHPERGEERFLVVQHDDGTVSYDLVAFSRPVRWARLGAPLARLIQVDVTRRYLRAMQDFVATNNPG